MRITIMGSGGVGGYFGARLAHAGCDVTFVARGAQLAALRARGLRIESARGDLHLPKVQTTDRPADIGSTDLVLLGVKLWDTASAAEAIKPLVHGQAAVISFQNGVAKDDILRDALGAPAVVGGVCYIAATIAEPGVIRHTGTMQKLVFGELDGQRSERVARFRDACASAGIDHEVSSDIRQAIWEKFVFLVGISGATTTMRVPLGVV
ncbi:MAG: 2-dehydropantoate 2-reductase, partial [Caldimonas sp.]